LTSDEVEAALRANQGKCVRFTWDDGETWSVDIAAVDDERLDLHLRLETFNLAFAL
jgi:hypothetical protein